MILDNYGYFLPEKNLAFEPAVPRDASKLFVYDTKNDLIVFDHFYNLDKYLPKDSFLVLNNTKVLPARVVMKKTTGGKIIILFLINELSPLRQGFEGQASLRVVRIMVDREVNVGDLLYFDKENYLQVVGQNENIFDLEFNFSREKLFFLLEKYGTMPIPPYLKKSPLTRVQLLEKYQTIFARAPVGARLASSAAPTASLHFTNRIFNKLSEKGIKKFFVTLHVGLGTFAPITNKNIKQKKLHEEYYEIDKETLQNINTLKQEDKKLVAVGTTVVRTLESIKKLEFRIQSSESKYKKIINSKFNSKFSILNSKLINKTDLFIFPPYNFKMADVLITNFHLPKSSLMMLVEAFLQHKRAKKSLVELYNIAIKNDFRFYSFGDAMIIL